MMRFRSFQAHRGLVGLLLLGMLALMPDQAAGQTIGRLGEVQASGTSYFTFAQPGEATVQVQLLGSRTGVFEVGTSVDLAQLLILAGITLPDGSLGGRAKTTITLYRLQGETRTAIYESELENLMVQADQYPVLEDGDLVYLKAKGRNIRWGQVIRTSLSIVSTALLVERLLSSR